jgi:hypothetical protein
VTRHPTAEWLAQQIVGAFPWEPAPTYLVRDNDGAYGPVFKRRVRAMGIRDRPISQHSPWQNPYAERLIGTLRRDCLDHVLVFGARHLRRVLAAYSAYYNETRTHLSLDKDVPLGRAIQPCGAIALALIRGFARRSAETIGNFWVDMIRCTLYVLLPLSVVSALFFAWQGIPQTLDPFVEATTLEGGKQTIAIGPVASQVAIKMLSSDCGGFFNANATHPFEWEKVHKLGENQFADRHEKTSGRKTPVSQNHMPPAVMLYQPHVMVPDGPSEIPIHVIGPKLASSDPAMTFKNVAVVPIANVIRLARDDESGDAVARCGTPGDCCGHF